MGNKNISKIKKTIHLNAAAVLPTLSYKIDVSHIPVELKSSKKKNSKESDFLFELPPKLKVERKVLKPPFKPSENISKIKKAIDYIAANAG
jgi:hypothetical protein